MSIQSIQSTEDIDIRQVIQKQLIINVLFDEKFIGNLVKEYCFVDKFVYATRKYFKKHICTRIEKAICTRRSDRINEHWSFGFYDYDYITGYLNGHRSIQLQAESCRFCGNYMISNVIDILPFHAICNCDRDVREIEEYIRMVGEQLHYIDDDFSDELHPNVTDRRHRNVRNLRNPPYPYIRDEPDDDFIDLFDPNDDLDDIHHIQEDYDVVDEEPESVSGIIDRIVRYETINGYGVRTVQYIDDEVHYDDIDMDINSENIYYNYIPGWRSRG